MSKFTHLLTIFVVLLAMCVGTVPTIASRQVREVRLVAADPFPGAEFGRSVAIDGDLAAVGASSDGSTGSVYVFKRQGQNYIQEVKLTAPDTSGLAEYGRSVAIQGNLLIVGARFAEVDNYPKAGAAYVYRKYQGEWHFEEKIKSPNPADEDNFGRALAVQGDLLVVTARKENLNATDVGAAYVFLFRDGTWTYQAKLTASDATPGAYFGQSVVLRGSLIAVGARNANPNGAGAVYIFRGSGNDWTEVAKVTPPDGNKNDQFAFTIAISGDVLMVGARRADLPGAADAGAVYVFSLWGESVEFVTKLTASDLSAGDEFGQSVAFVGGSIAVGAWRDDIGSNTNQGSIYIFSRIGNQWVENNKVTASDGSAGDEFGYSLAAFGNRMVTGAHSADSTQGAAYVIEVKP